MPKVKVQAVDTVEGCTHEVSAMRDYLSLYSNSKNFLAVRLFWHNFMLLMLKRV